jgi:hypothetical protein
MDNNNNNNSNNNNISTNTIKSINDKTNKIDDSQLDLIDNLFSFKNECLFTDIYIYVDGVEFPCHKVILCAASNYFKAMFSCDLKESRLGKVFIENISPWTMKRLLDYIYTGKIEINYDNVIDIFNAAVMFQLFKLVDKCTDYIQQHIDINNCIEINLFASMHNLSKLENDTFQFILENFMQLINLNTNKDVTVSLDNNNDKIESSSKLATTNQNDFVKLNEKTFIDLIKSDSLNVRREIYVYYAVNKWIENYSLMNAQNPTKMTRLNQLYENMFKYLRLNALSDEELEFILLNDSNVKSNKNLFDQIKNRLDSNNHDENKRFKQVLEKEEAANLDEFIENLKINSSIHTKNNLLQSSEMNQISYSNTKKINPRPSTIPREYLCLLNLDLFQFYDFYKSKWDSLNNFPPIINLNNLQHQSEAQANRKFNSNNNKHRLNGYSTCILNNILYVLGGHLINNPDSSYSLISTPSSKSTSESSSLYSSSTSLSPNDSSQTDILSLNNTIHLSSLELVDTVYKFDPIKNEWSSCKEMLRKRAFHTSVCLSTTTPTQLQQPQSHNKVSSNQAQIINEKNDYIFLFYGICYENDSSESNTSSSASRLVQCISIDFYNIETDSWSILNLNNSLLNHHIYQSFNQYNRNIQNQLENEPEINTNEENNQLRNFINLQLTQAKSILTLKNILYILNQNCIHCYEFNSKQSQLLCLPYFQLPINLNKFILAKAISVKDETKSSSCMSLFSWFSDADEEELDEENLDNQNEDLDETTDSSKLACKSEQVSEQTTEESSSTNKTLSEEIQDEEDDEELRQNLLYKNKKEALIYLLNPQQGIIYEFYPAKNKLLKLPNLCLKHLSNETFILKIKSKLYVTGGILDRNNSSGESSLINDNSNINSTAIEVFNKQTNSWSIFMNKLDSSSNLTSKLVLTNSQTNRSQSIPVTRNYLKLKMSLFH